MATSGVILMPHAGSVGVAWYGAKGAVQFEVMRTDDTTKPAVRIATVPSTTLGYEDRQVGPSAVYFYQVVSVGANGSRAITPFKRLAVPATSRSSGTATPTGGAFAGMMTMPHGGSASSQQSQLAAELAAALATIGVNVTASDLAEIVSGLTEGGNAAMSLAVTLRDAIARYTAQSSSTVAKPQYSDPPDAQHIDAWLKLLPPDTTSMPRFSGYVTRTLTQLKNAPSQHR